MRALVFGLLIAISMIGCMARRLTGPQLTGTCEGACAHYVQCKPEHGDADRKRCLSECPDVFSDSESLMVYESLACQDAVEYVDGSGSVTTARS